MTDLEQDLKYSYQILEHAVDVTYFGEYAHNYFSTTENIGAYLLPIETSIRRALTIIGGGDQIFNLASLGVEEIDAFDINRLSYYNYYLRQAIILSLSFSEFIKASKNSFYLLNMNQFSKFLEHLKPYLPLDVYEYYIRVLQYQRCNHPLFGMISLYRSSLKYKSTNLYAKDSDTYQKTQTYLRNLDLTLHFLDARNVPDILFSEYDFIGLSNVTDYLKNELKNGYTTVEEFNQFLFQYLPFLSEFGCLIVYLYQLNSKFIIGNSNIQISDMKLGKIYPITKQEGYYFVRKKV